MHVSRSQVQEYLAEVKESVRAGRYQIAPRDKNKRLYIDYIFSEKRCADVILSLDVDDFSDAVQNDHPQHPEEILYIFGKDVTLLPKAGGDEERISLYIKFNKLVDMHVIVISFHKQEYPLSYKYK